MDNSDKNVLVSPLNREVVENLKSYGFTVITTQPNENLAEPVKYHPDMLVSYIGKKKIIIDKSQIYLCHFLKNSGFDVILSSQDLKHDYPFDIGLNAIILQKMIIGLKEHISKELLQLSKINNLKLINCRQGYTKCSCVIISEKVVITSDENLKMIFQNLGFDVLKTRNDGIVLNGYNEGFIGGCCGMLHKNHLAVSGELKLYSDGEKIRLFCKNHNVYITELCKGPLNDIGGIVPLYDVFNV